MEEGRGEGEMEGSHTDGALGTYLSRGCLRSPLLSSPNISHLISSSQNGIHAPGGRARLQRVRTKSPRPMLIMYDDDDAAVASNDDANY